MKKFLLLLLLATCGPRLEPFTPVQACRAFCLTLMADASVIVDPQGTCMCIVSETLP